jgi:hypothetical protein
VVFSVLYGRYTTERIFLKLSLMKIVKYKYCIFILYDKNIPFYMDFYIQNKCYHLYFITNIVITFNVVYFYRDLLILDEYDDFYIILS